MTMLGKYFGILLLAFTLAMPATDLLAAGGGHSGPGGGAGRPRAVKAQGKKRKGNGARRGGKPFGGKRKGRK